MSYRTSLPALTSLTVTAGLLLGTTVAIDGQQHMTPRQQISGTVVDESTGAPLEGAFVVLEDGHRVETGPDGAFRFDSVEPGRYRIAALARGCSQVGGVIQLRPGQDRTVQFQVAVPRRKAGEEDPVRRGGSVKVIMGDRLEELSRFSLLEVIKREVPGLQGGSTFGAAPLSRGRTTIMGNPGMLLVLDGVRIDAGVGSVLAGLRADDVLRVEVVRGAAEGWSYGPGGGNGVIVVKTRSGPDSMDALRSARSCSVDWSAF